MLGSQVPCILNFVAVNQEQNQLLQLVLEEHVVKVELRYQRCTIEVVLLLEQVSGNVEPVVLTNPVFDLSSPTKILQKLHSHLFYKAHAKAFVVLSPLGLLPFLVLHELTSNVDQAS